MTAEYEASGGLVVSGGDTDAGRIVTDDEVIDFVPNITEISTTTALVIRAAEEAAEDYCRCSFLHAAYTDDPVRVRASEIRTLGRPLHRVVNCIIRNVPITRFDALKTVSAYDATTGRPSVTALVPRDAYHVEPRSGIVTLRSTFVSSEISASLFTSWPQGRDALLATYLGGYTRDKLPAQLKLAVLQIIARISLLQEKQAWHLDSVSTDFGTTTYKRVDLTDEEKRDLNRFRRGAYG
jgi:hypothetical protein